MILRRAVLTAICLMVIGTVGWATTLSIPYSFSPNTTIFSAQVNANNTAIAAVVNGQLDHNNLSSSAGILLTQLGLNPGGTAFDQTTSGNQTWASGLTTDVVPRISMFSDKGIQWGPGASGAFDVALQRTGASTLQLNNTSSGTATLDMNSGTLENVTLSNATFTGGANITTTGTIQGGTIISTGTLSTGANSGTNGQITLNGSTSGSIVIKTAAAAGTGTYTLPTALPTLAGQVLTSTTGGVMSWASTVPRFSSTGNAWTTGGSVGPFTPGFAAHKVWATFVCTTAQSGYNIGDEVTAYASGNNTASGWGLTFRNTSANSLTVLVGNNGVLVYNVTAGSGAMVSLVAADWTMSVYAEP